MFKSVITGLLLALITACTPTAHSQTPRGQLVMSDNQQVIYTVFDDWTGRVNLPEQGHTPSWTPDQQHIIYSPPAGDQIKVMDADGRNARVILSGTFQGISKPQLVGNLIIFSVVTPNNINNQVYKVNTDGSGLTFLATGSAAYLSPDGTWLTYTLQTPDTTSPAGFRREIWRINIDGTNNRPVTSPLMDADHPDGNASAISPDGGAIAVFWGLEEYGQPIWEWQKREVALVGSAGGMPHVVIPCIPATQSQILTGTYPPPPALIAADNPAFIRDPGGQTWIIYDGGRPDDQGGTFMITTNGQFNHRISPFTRGAGNIPMRYIGF